MYYLSCSVIFSFPNDHSNGIYIYYDLKMSDIVVFSILFFNVDIWHHCFGGIIPFNAKYIATV